MEENKPVINVKRFSRSKKNVDMELETQPEIKEKKTRGRKKKVIITDEPETIIDDPIIDDPIIDDPIIEEEEIPEIESFDDDFLNELNNTNFQKEKEEEDNFMNKQKELKEREKELIKKQKEEDKQRKEQEKFYKQQLKEAEKKTEKINKQIVNNDNDLYSEGAIVQGGDKIKLIHKIKQYKALFPEIIEVKNFKIKPNASENELKTYIIELETLTSMSSVDAFLTDSILQCIKVIEGPTSKTKNFNISGLSDLLKSNKQFHQLCKKLYLKYNCFDKIPEEYQLLMVVSTTAYICMNKNRNKDQLEVYLNEPIELKK